MLAPPLTPTKPSPLHLLLPAPTSFSNQMSHVYSRDEQEIQLEPTFQHYESALKNYSKVLIPLNRHLKQGRSRFQLFSSCLAELGAYYNAFSLEDNVITLQENITTIEELSKGIEKVGQAIDVNYVSSEILTENVLMLFEEPVTEMIQFIAEAQRVLQFRKLKKMQFYIIDATIKKRKQRIESLQAAQEQMERLEKALKRNAEQSPTIAHAVKNMNRHTERNLSLIHI